MKLSDEQLTIIFLIAFGLLCVGVDCYAMWEATGEKAIISSEGFSWLMKGDGSLHVIAYEAFLVLCFYVIMICGFVLAGIESFFYEHSLYPNNSKFKKKLYGAIAKAMKL